MTEEDGFIGWSKSDEGIICVVQEVDGSRGLSIIGTERPATEIDALDAASHFLPAEAAPFRVWRSGKIDGAIHVKSAAL